MNELAELIKTGSNALLEEKLSINPSMAHGKTEQGISLLQFAAYYRNLEAVEIITRYKGELDIFEAATVGDKATLQRKMKTDCDRINAFSTDGFTPLGLATYFGHFDAVKLLLDNGADPHIASSNVMHVTPLHSACATSNYDIAEVLLKSGVNVNAKQQSGVTPLHSAAHNGQARLARLLIEYGADINALTDNGQSPKDMADEKGHTEVAGLLK
jgi:ankyrin repeat protein